MKVRVLFVVNTTEYGGLEKHLLDVVRKLDSQVVVPVILSHGTDFYSSRLNDRTDIQIIAPARTRQSFWSYWLSFIKLKPDVIVFVKGCLDSYLLGAYLAAKLSGAKKCYAMEQLIADPVPEKLPGRGLRAKLRRLVGWRARYMLRYVLAKRLAGFMVDKTICISNAVRERLVKEYGFSTEKTVVIPNGIDLKFYDLMNESGARRVKACLGQTQEETIIVCVSRMVPRKRVDILLDALSMVLKLHPSCRCIIVGSGPSEKGLRTKCADLGLSMAVRFVGFAEDVRPYLKMSDIYVSASEKEGLGVSVIEAMACGLPCVVTNIEGHNEVVLHGDTGLLVSPGSGAELARAIDRLVVRREDRVRMGLSGRRRAEELFNLDKTISDIKNVLLDVV